MANEATFPAQDLLRNLGSLPQLDTDVAAARLQAAYLSTATMASLKGFFTAPKDQKQSCVFDGVDRTSDVEVLCDATQAAVMTKVADPYGFNKVFDQTLASLVPDAALERLLSALYAEHINEHLSKMGMFSLRSMYHDSNIVRQYKAMVESEDFDPIGSRDDYHYAMNVLFVYEYFHAGPGFIMQSRVGDVASVRVLDKWRARTTLPDDFSQAKKIVARFSYSSTAAFSPNAKASDDIRAYAYALEMAGELIGTPHKPTENPRSRVSKEIQEKVNAGTLFTAPELAEFRSVAHRVWARWVDIMNDQTPSTFWQTGIRASQAKTVKTSEPFIDPDDRWRVLWRNTVINGPELAKWYTNKKSSTYLNPNGKLNNVKVTISKKPSQYSAGTIGEVSCITSGTMVRTSLGDVPVQDLTLDHGICTKLSPTQWGVQSQLVIKKTAPSAIFGINDEPAFFTSGSVFHTTTGLRSLRPDLARAENPWAKIGQLAIGHQLLRAQKGSHYDLVQVRSINEESCHGDAVYGVSVQDGLHSYHANGFLVAMNYPELTVTSLAKQLQSLPSRDRVAVLKCFTELLPIFERFGNATALEALTREAESGHPGFGGKNSAQRFQAMDLNMPYVMKFRKGKPYGPSIELLQGILYVDGKFCEQAAFDKESLAWTRKLPDGAFEHAHCTFTQTGDVATGHLAVSTDTSPEAETAAFASARAFDLVPGTLETVPQTNGFDYNTPLTPNGVPHDEAQGIEDDVKMHARRTAMHYLEHYDQTKPRGQIGTVKHETAVAEVPSVYQMDYDPVEWGKGHDTPATAKTKCGRILLPRINNRLTWSKLTMEDPQTIKDKLEFIASQDTHISGLLKLEDFYRHTVTYDAQQLEHHTFELRNAEAFVESSDEFLAWKASTPDYKDQDPPIKNLHFTNLGFPSEFEIAELFSAVYLTKSLPNEWGIVSLSGVARSYSPSYEGNLGPAHVIVGTKVNASKITLADAAQAAVAAAHRASRPITHAHVPPSATALSLAEAAEDVNEKTLEDILKIALDLGKVNRDAQVTMTNVMQWHMKADDRKLFFGATNKPSGLPAELTTQLEGTPTAVWLRDTYATAYICQMLTVNDGQIGEKYRFSEQQKKNVRYFWNGKGANCLARSEIYKKLEREVSRYQMRRTYDVLNKVYKSGEGLGYSTEIYNRFTEDPDVVDSLPDTNPTTGSSLLSKLCTLMDAIDSGAQVERKVEKNDGTDVAFKDTNSNALAITSLARYKGDAWESQYWGSSDEDEKSKMLEDEWIKLSLRGVIEALLDNNPEVSSPVTEALGKEIAALAAKVEGWNSMSRKAKIEFLEGQVGPRMRKLMTVVSTLMGWVREGGRWVFQKGLRLVDNWRGTSRAIGDAATRIAGEQPSGLLGGPLLRGLMVLAGMAVIGFTIWSMNDRWASSSAADRGRMVTAVLLSFKQLGDLGTDAVYEVLRYRRGPFNHATELALFRRYNLLMRNQVRSRWANFLQVDNRRAVLYERLRPAARAAQNTREALAYEAIGERTLQTRITPVERIVNNLSKATRIQKAFNIARHALAVVGYILAVAVAIFMTWQLISDWNDMDTGTKIFNTIQTVLVCVEALLALFMIGAYAVWGVAVVAGSAAVTGIAAFVTVAATIFAAVAIVLAVLAVLVLIAFLIWQSKQTPPPNPAEVWMRDNGKPWADGHPAPPDPLEAKAEPTHVSYTSALQKMRVTFTNNSGKSQKIQQVVFSFASGDLPSGLFKEKLTYKLENEAKAGNATLETVSPPTATLTVVNQQSSVEEGLMGTDLTVAVKSEEEDPMPSFEIPTGGQIVIAAWGVIQNDKGESCTLNWTAYAEEDISEGEFTVSRAAKP